MVAVLYSPSVMPKNRWRTTVQQSVSTKQSLSPISSQHIRKAQQECLRHWYMCCSIIHQLYNHTNINYYLWSQVMLWGLLMRDPKSTAFTDFTSVDAAEYFTCGACHYFPVHLKSPCLDFLPCWNSKRFPSTPLTSIPLLWSRFISANPCVHTRSELINLNCLRERINHVKHTKDKWAVSVLHCSILSVQWICPSALFNTFCPARI